MSEKKFDTIQREDLKSLYIYIGPVVYNDKLFRMFRTRTKSHDYVFYNDDNGILTLASVEETWGLLKIFTFPFVI